MHVSTLIAIVVSFLFFVIGVLSTMIFVSNEESVRYTIFNPIKWGHDKMVFNHRSDIYLPSDLKGYDSFNMKLSSSCCYLIENVYSQDMNVTDTVIHKTMSYERSSDKRPFVYVMTKGDVIYIPIRGTAGLAEWVNNVKIYQDNYKSSIKQFKNTPSFMRSDNNIMIHNGFLDSYNRVAAPIIDMIKILMDMNPNYFICLTGHSMGGAVASILSSELNFLGYKNVTTYLFGTPRVGNKAFADYIENCEGMNMYSVLNTEDNIAQAIPAVSPNTSQHDNPFFYSFCGQSIYFSENWYSTYYNHAIVMYSKAVEVTEE